MNGILERIGSLAGTEWEEATDFAQNTYRREMAEHRHTGRAIVETIAALAREYNNLAGIAAGLLVERTLQYQKDRHDEELARAASAPAGVQALPPAGGMAPPTAPRLAVSRKPGWNLNIDRVSPGKIALQVFGALILLKLAAMSARMFRRQKKPDVWFAPAAKLRLFSTALTAYFLVAAIRSPVLSAWRNGAVALFATDAIKPLLKVPRQLRRRPA